MAKQFGKTWWGEQWLNSLSNIDFNNRLPRGATYARKGAVKEITINKNLIKAKVEGSSIKHRFITKGTFEERINEMIQSKKNLAEMTGENWIGKLNDKELRNIFKLG